MKFSKLYLKAFGPFTERLIDFDVAGASLHILYGPNEAGKSSLLRAIRAFLYGIPERTQDNFLHDNAALRVGGIITDGAERQLAAVRRKARKQSLRQWNGQVEADCEGPALSDNAILQLLGNIEEVQFSRVFGIDRDELIRGGQAILEGQGDVGESLFEAGSGLVGLRRLRAALEAEAAELFTPRASKPVVNAALTEYEEAKHTTRDAAIRTDEWTRRDDAYKTVSKTLEANKTAIAAKRLELERLARILRNLPTVARRQECLKEVAALSGVPDLTSDFAAQRAAAVTGLTHAERHRDETQRKVTQLEAQLGTITVPEGFIQREALIRGVHSRLGAFQQADLAIPELAVRQRNSRETAQAKFSELGLAGTLSEAEKYRPKKADQAKVRGLIQEYSQLTARNAELRGHETNLLAELEKARHALSARAQPLDPGRLDEAVQAASVHADSERRLSGLVRDLATRNGELTRKTRILGDRPAAALRDLRPPAKATLQRLQREAEAILNDRNVVTSQLAPRRQDLQTLRAEKSRREAGGVVPSEDELAKARAHREHGWQLVRQGYIERTGDPQTLAKEFAVDITLPAAYEQAVQRADAVVDGLRLDTARITKYQESERRVEELSLAIAADEAKLLDFDARQQKWLEEWGAITSSLGVNYPTVRELEEWLAARDGIVAELGEIEQRQREADELQGTLAAARVKLATEAPAHGATVSDSDTFTVVLAKARELLVRARSEKTDYDDAKKAVDTLRGELAAHAKRIDGLTSELTAWRSRWDAAVAAIGLSKSVEPQEAEARLSLLDEFFDAVDEAHRAGTELSEKQATVAGYSDEIRSLAAVLGVAQDGKSIGELAVNLFTQYQAAVKLAHQHEQVSAQLAGAHHALESANGEFARKERELDDLCRAAAVTSVADLPAVEERALRKRRLQDEISAIEKQLIEINSAPLERILEESAAADRDLLSVRLASLDAEIQDLDSSQLRVAQEQRDAQRALEQVDGSAKAAEAAQRTQELLAAVRNAAEEYARLKASSFVIGRAIEAYRQKHQGPILARASQYFLALTRGSFKKLDLDLSEDRPVLAGVRANGKPVFIGGMSEGTRDQLYLALRLAAIESHLGTGLPVPVIVDDILVQFDEARAQTALEALGMLAKHTQVLLLTHHEHIVSLAQHSSAKNVLAVHRLDVPVERKTA